MQNTPDTASEAKDCQFGRTSDQSKERRKSKRKKKSKSQEFVEDSSDDLWISLSEPELDIRHTSATYAEADKPNSPFTTQCDKTTEGSRRQVETYEGNIRRQSCCYRS